MSPGQGAEGFQVTARLHRAELFLQQPLPRQAETENRFPKRYDLHHARCPLSEND